MQSENGKLLLFYIFLSHGNERKKKKKKGVWCKRGDAVSCPQVPLVPYASSACDSHKLNTCIIYESEQLTCFYYGNRSIDFYKFYI